MEIFGVVNQGVGIVKSFDSVLMPLFMEIGVVLFKCSVIWGIYRIIRSQYTQGVTQIKWAAIGYISLRMTDAFVTLVDTVARNMKLGG